MAWKKQFLNNITCMDAFDLLTQITSDTIDLILTDPPYGISHEMTINRGSQGKFSGNDLTSDYGEWDKFDDVKSYYGFTDKWMYEACRVLRPGGTLISFFDKKKITYLYEIGEMYGLEMRDEVAWVKSNPVPQVRKVKFAQAVEVAGILQKPGDTTFNWQLGYHPNYHKAPIVGGHERLKDEDGNTLHPTQKPESLMRWLIDYFSNPWDVVLDPFCGVGTVAVECWKSTRMFICADINEEYCEAGRKRLLGTQKELFEAEDIANKLCEFGIIDYQSHEYKEKHRC